jgi:hypothetical protein
VNRTEKLSIVTPRRPRCRAVFLFPLLLALGSGALPAQADDTLAKSVPADIGFFVEIRDAADLLIPLLEPQIWTTLADFAGQPAQAEDAAAWRKQIEKTVRMPPEQAIRTLLAQRVAFVGEGPRQTQDAVVVCRPTTPIKQLLESWKARRLEDAQFKQPATYQLSEGAIGVAQRDDLLYFGTLLPANGLFRRMLPVIAQPAAGRLADEAVFKRLRARVPENADGILFVRLGGGDDAFDTPIVPVSQPASTAPAASQPASSTASRPSARKTRLPDLPGPLRNAQNILVALQRDGSRLHFTAVGDKPRGPTPIARKAPRMIAALPERTLAAWQGNLDFATYVDAILSLPENNRVRWALSQPNQGETARALASAIGSSTCVAIGAVQPAGRTADTPPLPAFAVLVPVLDAETVTREMATISDTLGLYYNMASLTRGIPPLQPAAQERIGDVTASFLNFSPLIEKVDRGAVGELHLAWTVHDGVLIVATHLDWLREILAARADEARRWSAVLGLAKPSMPEACDNVLAVQTGPLSDVGALWLTWIEKNVPEVLSEQWWRRDSIARRLTQLGINTRRVPQEPAKLRVISVEPNSPCDDRIRVGDLLIGAGGKRFATSQPQDEIRTAIAQRPNGRYVMLHVERDGAIRDELIPLPYLNLIQTLRRAVAIGKIAQRFIYFDDQPEPAGSRGFLTVELRKDPAPLFRFQKPTPASAPLAPASQPAAP